MHEPVRMGVIGCGRVAQAQHLRVLSSLAGVELVALADADEASLNKASSRFARGAQTFGSYEAMLGLPEVQAVVICLPTAMHADCAMAAFDAGKHVYLEKPIGVDVAEAKRVVQSHQGSNVMVQMGFNYRYHRAYTALCEELNAGRIGTVAAGVSTFCSPPRQLQGWKTSRSTGGGVLLDLFVHHADLVSFLVNEPIASVFASTRSVQTEDDTASITMKMVSGLAIQTTVSSVAAQADTFRFTGDKGSLEAGRFGAASPIFKPARVSYEKKDRLLGALNVAGSLPSLVHQALFPPSERSYDRALAAFAQAVRSGKPSGPGLEEGYRAALVVEAAEQSAKTGAFVAVDAGDLFSSRPQRPDQGAGV